MGVGKDKEDESEHGGRPRSGEKRSSVGNQNFRKLGRKCMMLLLHRGIAVKLFGIDQLADRDPRMRLFNCVLSCGVCRASADIITSTYRSYR